MAAQGPTPVDTGAAALVVTRPIDRAPAPVAPGPGTTGRIPTVATPQGPPESAPPSVAPGPGTGQSTGPAATVTPAVVELPVETPTPADQGNNVIPTVPNLIEVLADGTIVVQNASALNFTGPGVAVTASGSTATLNITSGSTYANSNVVTLLSSFGSNTLVTTGNATAGYFIGNGSQLTGITAASSYGNANVVANLAALGSNPVSTTGNITGGNLLTSGILQFSGGSKLRPTGANLDIFAGTGSYVQLVNSNESSSMGVDSAGGYIVTPGGSWGFSTTGTFSAPGNFSAVGAIQTGSNITGGNVLTGGLVSATGNITGGNLSGTNIVGTLTTAAQAGVTTVGTLGNLAVSGQANVTQQINTARVSATGNITGNYFIGNGSQLTGIAANTGNVTFNNQAVIGTGDQQGFSGLYLAPGTQSVGNLQYLRVRGGDLPTHIHLDTGNNTYFDQYFGDDNKYIKLGNTGNIVINTNNLVDASAQWTFGTDGTLTAPGNISAINLVINNISSDDSTFVTIEDGVNISSGAISSQENLSLTANAYTWTFRNDGIGLVLPNSARITDTNLGALAIGYQAGFLSQANTAVAIGYQAALTAQGAGAVAIGRSAGNSQSDFAVAIGSYAGVTNQGNAAVAVGKEAGNTTQGFGAVAIGSSAGSNTQGGSAVALGDSAGQNSQGVYSVAIGYAAAQNNQGASAVAIGFYAGQTSQANNSIILNATGSALNQTTANTFTVAPVRNDVANTAEVMFYNTTSKEVTYGNVISVAGNITGGNILGGANVNATTHTGTTVSVTANITGGNLLTGGLISATGNVSGNYFIGNGAALTGIAASVPGQTILPTIQTITIAATSNPFALSGGQGGANVTVANTIPVTEYGVIITSGTSSQKYATGALGSIPGTVPLTFTTGLNNLPFTVFAYVTSNAGTYYSDSATGTSGICLLAGTQIALSDGTHKAIEHITYTDKLLSWDFDRGCYAETTAIWIKRGETGSQYNLLTFSDGTTLRTFDQHRIFNKQAGAFTYPMTSATPVGTITVNEHGQEIILTNKQVIQDTIEYYNVITDYHMNLFSDSVLTSCRFNNIYPITNMKFVKDSRTLRTRAEFENVPDRFFHGLRLAEQTTDVETVEWYVNRLLSTEVSTESELAV